MTSSSPGRSDQGGWGLRGSPRPLTNIYDVALLDLDGVVYIGHAAVPGAPQALKAARAAGMRLAFVTNNAARSPAVVAKHLDELGIPAKPIDVITSAQAAARYLADRLPFGAPVLVLGTTGLIEAICDCGLTPIFSADQEPLAVVQGFSPKLDWRMLAEGCVAISRGIAWIATNLDATVPSSRGPVPGNGSLVAALRQATGKEPTATGKPSPVMHRESVRRTAAERPLVVGDRLDTDIEGARASGCHSLLVLSGVTAPIHLLAADPKHRPDYIDRDVSGLLRRHRAPVTNGVATASGRWSVFSRHRGLELICHPEHSDSAAAADDDLDALRALCAAAWRTGESSVRPGDRHAEAALARLGVH